MGVNTLGLSPRRADLAPEATEALPPDQCSLAAVARVLSGLLHRPVSVDQVRDKAVGLGLLRQPDAGAETELTIQAVSRLLLAGYHLPAQVELGTVQTLASHVQAGRLVSVLSWSLPAEAGPNPALAASVFQVHAFHDGGPGSSWLLVSEPGGAAPLAQCVPLDHPLPASWATARLVLLVAVQQWSELPQEGIVFFGGSRDAAGVYHWDSAECDTDAAGRILRY